MREPSISALIVALCLGLFVFVLAQCVHKHTGTRSARSNSVAQHAWWGSEHGTKDREID